MKCQRLHDIRIKDEKKMQNLARVLVGGATGGGFETLRGDKTHCFISINPKLTINRKLTIHTLSFSLMFLTILSTHINTSWAHYLYTKSEYEKSNFHV